MRKFAYLLLFLVICGTATAQRISVPEDVEVVPGEIVYYTIHVDVEGGVYDDFQFHHNFPRSGFSIPPAPNTKVNPLWAGSIETGPIFASNFGRALGESDPGEHIPTGEIALVSIGIQVADDMPLGEYEVTITNFEFITPQATGVLAKNDASFKIKVVDVLTVVLDENSTEAPTAADGVNVLVKRTINANEWGTICLPFAMTAEQVTAAFGDDVKLCDFTGHDFEEAANGDITAITMNFEAVSPLAIEANHPYIIKVSSPVTQFEVENVDIVPEEDPCIEFDNGKTGSRRVVFSGFYGTYQAQTTVPEFALFLSSGQFYYSKGLTKMKAFRAYFETQEILSNVENAAGAKIGLNIGGETTSLNEELRMKNEEFAEGVYDLLGRKVATDTGDLSKLKSGVYIINGKKIVKK